jgi:putative hydrolase of the HAD superfamily
MTEKSARKFARKFTHVDTWVFDLDNTLYPRHINLWQQVDARIADYVARYLKLPADEAYAIQKELYKRYGTTMRGMMTEYDMDAYDYLKFVHDIDHSPLEPDPALGAAIAELPGRKLILTNGTREHADAVLKRLGIDPHFEDVFGIIEAEFEPKPSSLTYEKFFSRHAIAPERAAMFEDLARNLEVPHRFGMTTVLVVPEGEGEHGQQAWEKEGRDADFVDHITDNLTGFLARILTAK